MTRAINQAASMHVNKFIEEIFDVHMEWLQEIQQEAIKVFSSSGISLLPKTPSMKRKRADITKINVPKYESTFHEDSENKKMKIDDLSTIIDNSVTILVSNSMNTSRSPRQRYKNTASQSIDTTDGIQVSDSMNKSRSLRPRKKNTAHPVKRSQRINSKKKVVAPTESQNVDMQSTHVQPKVAALIESLGFTTPKRYPLFKDSTGEMFKNVEAKIDFASAVVTPDKLFTDVPDGNNKVDETTIPTTQISKEKVDNSKCRQVVDKILGDSIEVISVDTPVRIDEILVDTPVCIDETTGNVIVQHVFASTPSNEVKITNLKSTDTSPKSADLKFCVVGMTGKQNLNSINDGGTSKVPNTQLSGVARLPEQDVSPSLIDEVSPSLVKEVYSSREQGISLSTEKYVSKSPESDASPSPIKVVSSMVHEVVPPSLDLQDSPSLEIQASQSPEQEICPSLKKDGHLSCEEAVSTSSDDDDEVIIKAKNKKTVDIAVNGGEVQKDGVVATDKDGGRRDTYKIVVNNIIEGNDGDKSKPQYPKKVLKKAPNSGGNVVTEKKPNSGGNVVTDKKTFLKTPFSPKQETGTKMAIKKFEKNELIRQKGVEEMAKRNQKKLEERKRQRENRERRFLEQQMRKQEEEESKRKLLEIKSQVIAKNQEEIRKQRENEVRKNREIQDLKKAEIDARRQKGEEEQKRKLLEQLRDERRKQEILHTKALLEEQKRIEKKVENEKADKERIRLIEEERCLDEDRKKREFEEKENHRMEVERKKKEMKDKERLEVNHLREERLRQAEKEIIEAKKREERLKEKEAKDKLKNTAATLPGSFRASPRLAQKQNDFKMPSKDLACTNSPAAYLAKKAMQSHNPPIAYNPPASYLPKKVVKPYNPPVIPLVTRESVYTSYGIDDLVSDDSTDDESEPSKRVPSWAMGAVLKKQLMRQYCCNVNPDDIFINCMEPLRLERIFNKQKVRYFKRTSSAHWSSPPLKGAYIYNKLLQK